ncbi:MAG: tRNA pseudouridine(13) synthase TruD [Myxococcaceae bacterium]
MPPGPTASGWPRLTEELPGTGGRLKEAPEDFLVEEVPAFAPTGRGEHLWLWVKKRGRETAEVARALARAAAVDVREVGYAGLKDRQAVTTQAFTVPWAGPGPLGELGLEGVQVLRTERTERKLRTGQLWGNAFRVRLREPHTPQAASVVLQRLVQKGLPNYFGPQRFGRAADNAARGRALLLGQRLPGRVDRLQRRLYLSAYQALLFNRALAARLSAGLYGRALLGDVLRRADSGGLFVCLDVEREQPRVDSLEVSPTGPMFGWKVKPVPEGEVGAAEAALLASEGLPEGALRSGKGETEGARRPYASRLAEVEAAQEGKDVWLGFRLPRGSYATVLLDEVAKPPGPLGPEEPEA